MVKNVWYVIGKRDKNNPSGYSQLTPKGEYWKTLPEIRKDLKGLQKIYKDLNCKIKTVILKRTCEVIR